MLSKRNNHPKLSLQFKEKIFQLVFKRTGRQVVEMQSCSISNSYLNYIHALINRNDKFSTNPSDQLPKYQDAKN